MITPVNTQQPHAPNRHATMSSLRTAMIWNAQRPAAHDFSQYHSKDAAMQTDLLPKPLHNHTVLSLGASMIWKLYQLAAYANSPHPLNGIIMQTLQKILAKRSLSALFQPIMDISTGAFFGFEGLIRGPADSPMHSPVSLFSAARQQGLTVEIEMLCRQIVLESFAAQKLPGKIFLNVSPEALTHPSFKNGGSVSV